MKKILFIIAVAFICLFAFSVQAQTKTQVPFGGTGTGTIPQGSWVYGNGTNPIGASSSPTVNYITATSGTSTITNLNATNAVSILGEYFTNFTTYVRSLFTAGTGINISSGSISVDQSFTPTWTGRHIFNIFPEASGVPTTTNQLVNKAYVDSIFTTGSRFVDTATAGTTGALPANTYNNGASGVGATLTGNVNGALTAQDGVTLTAGQTLLVKDESTSANNGFYTVTTVGNAGTPYVLTRVTSYDVQAEIQTGTFFNVLNGSTNANKQYIMNNNTTITVGTTPITFALLSASNVYTSSSGIGQSGFNFFLNLMFNGGLGIGGGQVYVDVDNTTIATTSNKLEVKDSGISTAKIANLAVTAGKIADSAISLTGTKITGILGVTNGGTGTSTITAGHVLLGNGTSPVTSVAPSTAGNVLTSTGSSWTSSAPTGGGGATASTSAGTTQVSLTFLSTPQTAQTWTDMPVTEAEIFAATSTTVTVARTKLDMTRGESFRLVARQLVAGATGANLRLQCSSDQTTWTNADTGSAGTIDIGVLGTQPRVGNWANLATACKGDVFWRLVGLSGNAVADPSFRELAAQFRLTQPASGSTATSSLQFAISAAPQTTQAWTNQPATLVEIFAATSTTVTNARYALDTTNATKYRIVANQQVAGLSTARMYLQCSADNTTFASSSLTSADVVDIGTGTGMKVGAVVDLNPTCIGAMYWRLVGEGGNGVADPAFRGLWVEYTMTEQALGSASDWTQSTTYSTITLTPSTTIAVWLKDALFASSTSIFDGLGTFNLGLDVNGATSTFAGIEVDNGKQIKFAGYSSNPQIVSADNQTGFHFDGPGIVSIHNSGSQSVLVNGSGNVGIGTTSPYSKLSVVGTATVAVLQSTTSATSTFGGGINLTAGCFSIGGTCLGGGGSTLQYYAENASAPSTPPSVTTGQFAIGDGAISGGLQAVALGFSSEAYGVGSVALGRNAYATDTASLCLGYNCTATMGGATAIGNGADATGNGSIAIGESAESSNTSAIAIGQAAVASAVNAMAFGTSVEAPQKNSIIFGDNSTSYMVGFNSSTPMSMLTIATSTGDIRSGIAFDTIGSNIWWAFNDGNNFNWTVQGDGTGAGLKVQSQDGTASLDYSLADGILSLQESGGLQIEHPTNFPTTTISDGSNSFSFGRFGEQGAGIPIISTTDTVLGSGLGILEGAWYVLSKNNENPSFGLIDPTLSITSTLTMATSTGSTTLTTVALDLTTTSTTTATHGIDIDTGCFAISGVCIGGGDSTDKWATSSDLTSIYPNTATKVGIGSSSPFHTLSVDGDTGIIGSTFRELLVGSNSINLSIVLKNLSGIPADIAMLSGVTGFSPFYGVGIDSRLNLIDAQSSGASAITFMSNSGSNNTTISYDTSADALNFLNASGGYFFNSGNVGVATSSSYAQFSVLDATNNGTAVSISTSTDSNYGQLLTVISTSTVLTHTSSLTNFFQDIGVRIGVGTINYLGFGGLLDHFVIRGRVNTEGWFGEYCDNPVGLVAIAADGIAGCSGYSFAEDGTATLTATAGNGYHFGILSTTVAADGAGVWLNSTGNGFLRAATSTPVLEVTARIGTAQNASTTQFYLGFTNVTTSGTAIDTAPTAGCFFTASSTEANWRAVCRTALGTGTYQDTGVASSTVTTGSGAFRLFRIEMDGTTARFYIQQPNGNLVKTNEISHSLTTQALNAGVHYFRTQGVAVTTLDFFRLRTWWRDFVPAL